MVLVAGAARGAVDHRGVNLGQLTNNILCFPHYGNRKTEGGMRMIVSFADRRTRDVYHGTSPRSLPPELIRRARRKLDRIHYAVRVTDLRAPRGNHLQKLVGDRVGQYSIRVTRRWRICFWWRDGDAYDVELNNHYH